MYTSLGRGGKDETYDDGTHYLGDGFHFYLLTLPFPANLCAAVPHTRLVPKYKFSQCSFIDGVFSREGLTYIEKGEQYLLTYLRKWAICCALLLNRL
jgi:hypothetical protein